MHENVDDAGKGLGFRVEGTGDRVQGTGYKVQGTGYRVQGAGFRVQGTGYRVQGTGYRDQGTGYCVQVSRLPNVTRRSSSGDTGVRSNDELVERAWLAPLGVPLFRPGRSSDQVTPLSTGENSQLPHYCTEIPSDSKDVSYLRLLNCCITHL